MGTIIPVMSSEHFQHKAISKIDRDVSLKIAIGEISNKGCSIRRPAKKLRVSFKTMHRIKTGKRVVGKTREGWRPYLNENEELLLKNTALQFSRLGAPFSRD